MNLDATVASPGVWITILMTACAVLIFAANAAWLRYMDRKQHEVEGLVSRSNDTKEF